MLCFRRLLFVPVSAPAPSGWSETAGIGEKAETLKG